MRYLCNRPLLQLSYDEEVLGALAQQVVNVPNCTCGFEYQGDGKITVISEFPKGSNISIYRDNNKLTHAISYNAMNDIMGNEAFDIVIAISDLYNNVKNACACYDPASRFPRLPHLRLTMTTYTNHNLWFL